MKADDFLRNGAKFKSKAAGKMPGNRIKAEEKLEDIYGSGYKDRVSGVTRLGTAKNPTSSQPTDFTDGTMIGLYEMGEDGKWYRVTMYPDPQ